MNRLERRLRFDIARRFPKGGPMPMLQLTSGRYGDDRYRAVVRMIDAGELKVVWDRWGWGYVMPAGEPAPTDSYWRV